MAEFRIVRPEDDLGWPSGAYRTAALLALSPAELEWRLGAPLAEGVEPGLGPWRGIGLILDSGWPVELICYEQRHGPRPGPVVALRVDVLDDDASARAEVVGALGLGAENVEWLPPRGGSDRGRA
jgi:hypothetical protein